MLRLVIIWLGSLTACQHAHRSAGVSDALHSAVDTPAAMGTLIYEGATRPRGSGSGDGPALYHYERRVLTTEAGARSSHVTFSPEGAPVLLQQADRSPAGELIAFREIHTQLGLVGQVDVGADGTVTYQATVGGRTRARTEPPGDPLQVGPTLFAYVQDNWDSLVAGNSHPFRFVVLDKRRSYRFELEVVDGPPGTTTFEMTPTDRLVALVVPSALLVFDGERKILQYAGLVPPLIETGRRLKRLDATVTYQHTGEAHQQR